MKRPLAYIVEDDKLVAEAFEVAVREAGYETLIIQDGKEAVEQLNARRPDLVVLDLRLPSVPGVRILQHIRNTGRLEGVRVIVVSADTTLTTYLREAADLVLVKPVGYSQLRDMALRMMASSDGDQGTT